MTRPGLEPAPPASEANALTITLSGPFKWLPRFLYVDVIQSKSLRSLGDINDNDTDNDNDFIQQKHTKMLNAYKTYIQ